MTYSKGLGGGTATFTRGASGALTFTKGDANAGTFGPSGAGGGVSFEGDVFSIDFTDIGATTDLAVITEEPLIGQFAADGVVLHNQYTWADALMLGAANFPGATILVTDWYQLFWSDGANWIPMGNRLVLACGMDVTSWGNSATHQDVISDLIPAGLLVPGCLVEVSQFWVFTHVTSAQVATIRIWLAANAAANMGVMNLATSANTTVGVRVKAKFYVTSITVAAASTHCTEITAHNHTETTGGDALALDDITVDWSADVSIYHGFLLATAADTGVGWLRNREVIITWPI